MAKSGISWLSYLGGLQQQTFSKDDLLVDHYNKMFNIKELSAPFLTHIMPWAYLLDYTSSKYLFATHSLETMLGYKVQDFLDYGVSFTLDYYNQKHLQLFNEEIFPDRLAFLKTIPPAQHPDYIFSYNFQVKNKKGEFVNLLQRNSFIKSDQRNNPLMSMGVIFNVNHYRQEGPVVQVIEKMNSASLCEGPETVFKKSYYLNKEDNLFTKREKEILPYLAGGLCSKEIAAKLFISEYTVTNHRRNMMLKTNSLNISQLIAFALTNCII